MKKTLGIIFFCLLVPLFILADDFIVLRGDGNPISTKFDGDDNKLTISNRFDGECTLQQYDCNASYFWTVPGMAEYTFMRFSVTGDDTSLANLYISVYQPETVDTPSMDIFVCASDSNGFPNLDSIYYQTTVAYSNLVWHPNFVTIDLRNENLSFHNDFQVGFRTNRSAAPQGVLAVTTDDGSCGSERSSIYRTMEWHHLRDVTTADYNFLIRVSMCNFDIDGDSILNDSDNCPQAYNPLQEDSDADSVGDVCDNCINTINTNQLNSDNDHFGDACDNCPDSTNPDQTNSDNDSYGDACDNCPTVDNEDQADDDRDGLGNICDNCPLDSLNDIDNDGICGDVDNCPAVYNPLQEDDDGDGIGNACDECTDSDNDGYGDPGYPANTCLEDNCSAIYNPGQEDADNDGIGDSCDTCTDTDNDGYGNPGYPNNTCATDNCPAVYNPSQSDLDGDTIGDSCDICMNDAENDIDNDGICGDIDNCHKTYNPDQLDTDGDGIGDACETLDSVFIDIGKPGQATGVDTLYSGFNYQIRLWFRNEVLLGGFSTGFQFNWDSAISITWLSMPDGYGPQGQGTGLSCVTVERNCRMYPPDQIWDMGGFRVDETNMDAVSPDTILLGGVSLNGRFNPGELQHMISFNFQPEINDDSVYTLCVDSAFVPPTGSFIFVDFDGDQLNVELNRDLCWVVKKLCGDANGDGLINVGDAVFLINYVFRGGSAPQPIETGDENGDGETNVGDAVYLINHIFKSGPSPICP